MARRCGRQALAGGCRAAVGGERHGVDGDSLNRDLRPPAGVPMFWPVSDVAVNAYPWFVETAKLGGEGSPWEFVLSLLAIHNLYALAWEAATLFPVIAVVAWWRARHDQRRSIAGNPDGNQTPERSKPGS
jgi:hypothetical protein